MLLAINEGIEKNRNYRKSAWLCLEQKQNHIPSTVTGGHFFFCFCPLEVDCIHKYGQFLFDY